MIKSFNAKIMSVYEEKIENLMSNSLSFRCHFFYFGTEFFFSLVIPIHSSWETCISYDDDDNNHLLTRLYNKKQNNQKYETIQIKWHLFSFVFFSTTDNYRLRIRLFAFKCNNNHNNNENLFMNNGKNSIKIKEINFFSKFTSLNEWYLSF